MSEKELREELAAITRAALRHVERERAAGSGELLAQSAVKAAARRPAVAAERASRFSSQRTTKPTTSALATAAAGRYTATRGPSNASVTRIETTSVSGTETRNDAVAPLLAPRRRSAIAAGSTLHEHSGSGAPISAAHNTGRRPVPVSRAVRRGNRPSAT